MEALKSFLNSPVGPKTVHFWGPMANWALVIAALMDANKPVEQISERMTITLYARMHACTHARMHAGL